MFEVTLSTFLVTSYAINKPSKTSTKRLHLVAEYVLALKDSGHAIKNIFQLTIFTVLNCFTIHRSIKGVTFMSNRLSQIIFQNQFSGAFGTE